MAQTIIVSGATGFIGRNLCRILMTRGYWVVALSRHPERASGLFGDCVEVVGWDAQTPIGWARYADGALGIINLTGENIASGRWTPAQKATIRQSRLAAGNAVVAAVQQARNRPRVVIQASGIGYYGNRGEELVNEYSPPGAGFLAEVAREWESSTQNVTELGVRHVIIRTGIVLGRNGGFLSRIQLPYRLFLGGHPGNGKQWLSWIHIKDEIEAICFLLEQEKLAGPFNLCAPHPLRARDFFHSVGSAMGRPSWLTVPGFVLRIMLGQMAEELILAGQRAAPKRLLEEGFRFLYPDAQMALRDIIG